MHRQGSSARTAVLQRWAWPAYVALVAIGIAVDQLLPDGDLVQSIAYDVVGLSAVAAIVAGVLLNRPERPLPWLLLAIGHLLFVIGDVLWTVVEQTTGEIPYPSVADLAYLGGYPFLVLAFVICVGLRVRGGDRAAVLDGAILATSASVIGWVQLVEPALAASVDLDPAGLAVSLAYPLVDLLILGVALAFLATPGSRSTSALLLVAGFVFIFIADVAYALQIADGTYLDGGPLDALWLGSYGIIGVAALHPSMRAVAAPHPVPVVWLGPVRLIALATALIAGPIVLFVRELGQEAAMPIVAAGSILLAILVLGRLALVVRALAADVHARGELELELSFQAAHDPLTGLANRRRFVQKLEDAVRPKGGARLSLLFLDLDDFKTVNDTLGHGAGDELLTIVAQRIRSLVRPGDLAARLGGDEFGVLLADTDVTAATAIAERLLGSLREPVQLGSRTVNIRASIGIADGGRPGTEAGDLVRDADVAMYQAKAMGKGRAQVFAPSMHAIAMDRLALQGDLEHALDQGQFRVAYQPIVDLTTGRPWAIEALARWAHPERGLLGAVDFIPLAEETGAILGLGRWMLQTAVTQAVRWRGSIDRDLAMSVNLSARQLADPRLLDDVRAALASAGLPPSGLILEVTESILVEDGDLAMEHLNALRAMGIRVAIDDFGTGYSSLSYLQRLPADILKIDRAFIAQLTGQGDGGVLARLIIGLGETLALQTVAEGVEDAAQLEALQRLGCRFAQGAHIQFPEPAERLEARLRATDGTSWIVETPSRVTERRTPGWQAGGA